MDSNRVGCLDGPSEKREKNSCFHFLFHNSSLHIFIWNTLTRPIYLIFIYMTYNGPSNIKQSWLPFFFSIQSYIHGSKFRYRSQYRPMIFNNNIDNIGNFGCAAISSSILADIISGTSKSNMILLRSMF